MKVRFDNPTFIVYKFISFKAFCLSWLAGRTKRFTAWQYKSKCRKAGPMTDDVRYNHVVSLFIRDSYSLHQWK